MTDQALSPSEMPKRARAAAPALDDALDTIFSGPEGTSDKLLLALLEFDEPDVQSSFFTHAAVARFIGMLDAASETATLFRSVAAMSAAQVDGKVAELIESDEMDDEGARELATLAPPARKRTLLAHLLEQADDFSGEEVVSGDEDAYEVEEVEGEDDEDDDESAAFSAVQDAMRMAHGVEFVMLDDPGSAPSRASLLALDHLLLPARVAKRAVQLAGAMRQRAWLAPPLARAPLKRACAPLYTRGGLSLWSGDTHARAHTRSHAGQVRTISTATCMTRRVLPCPVSCRALCRVVRARVRHAAVSDTWPGGATSLGNALLVRHLIPLSKEAERDAGAGRWEDALGRLLGMALFCAIEDGWLADNEVHLQWGDFEAFFLRVSTAWRDVLEQSDTSLGLASAVGLPGGYRARLLGLVAAWERETNRSLRQLYDDDDAGRAVRVRITTKEGDEVPSEGEGESEEEGEEGGNAGEVEGSNGSKAGDEDSGQEQ